MALPLVHRVNARKIRGCDRSTLFSRHNERVTAADPPNQEPTVVARLRYRPAADVLVGEVSWPVPAVGTIEDAPDDDTRRVWSRTTDGHQRLEEFLIIRAAERMAASESLVPNALSEALVDLLTSGLLELETSQGKKYYVRPGDILFTEDFEGQGHITRSLRDIRGFFHVTVPDSFEVTSWPLVRSETLR